MAEIALRFGDADTKNHALVQTVRLDKENAERLSKTTTLETKTLIEATYGPTDYLHDRRREAELE